MAFSGIIKDPDTGLFARGSYPLRAVTFTALAMVLGWLFLDLVPQLTDLALIAVAGLSVGLILVVMVAKVSSDKGNRMFASLFVAGGFVVGYWGMWIDATFGAVPSLDQLRASAVGQSYALTVFGEPILVQDRIFEIWVGTTAVLASFPILFSLTKPIPGGARQHPFHVHADFAQSFGSRFIMLPLIGFCAAMAAVYAPAYLAAYGVPLELAALAPLAVAALYTRLHMTFIKALIIAVLGGLAGAAGFWLPWLHAKLGQDGLIAFVQNPPLEILAQVQAQAADANAVGMYADFTPWTFEIWAGLTLAYLCLPLFIILARRYFYLMRPV